MFQEIKIEHDGLTLEGHLSSMENLKAWVIFAHGSGSSRKSPRNNWIAQELNKKGYGTFLFDLLTPEEDRIYENRFDIPLLAERLLTATAWLMNSQFYTGLPIAYFGASTGGGAALIAAARSPESWPIYTVVSRGGRPDLAGKFLKDVRAPVLLLVGSLDLQVIELNQLAGNELKNVKLTLVEGATHLFEEPGKLAEVLHLTITWLDLQLPEEEELRWTP